MCVSVSVCVCLSVCLHEHWNSILISNWRNLVIYCVSSKGDYTSVKFDVSLTPLELKLMGEPGFVLLGYSLISLLLISLSLIHI